MHGTSGANSPTPPNGFRGNFLGRDYLIELHSPERNLAQEAIRSPNNFDSLKIEDAISQKEICHDDVYHEHNNSHDHDRGHTSSTIRQHSEHGHIGTHGSTHAHSHEEEDLLPANAHTTKPARTPSPSSTKKTDLPASSREIVFSMISSTWTNGGATPVLLCVALMVITKIVKVTLHVAPLPRK
jgi:hypothetical protein